MFPFPKDLSEIKQKFIAGLTKRQSICFGIGFAIGIPAFFLCDHL
ncbi:PrgI family protein [Ruminococcus sp.]